MTPEERIDAAIDSVLKASGSAINNYSMQLTLERMREAMRKVMSDSYISGSNDAFDVMKKADATKKAAGTPHSLCSVSRPHQR